MKKVSRRSTAAPSPNLARWGAVLAARTRLARGAIVVAGVAVLAVAGFMVLRGNAPASRPSASFTPQVTGAPRLSADKPKVDLGDGRLGQTVQAAFELANTGDRPLQFTEAPYIEVIEGC